MGRRQQQQQQKRGAAVRAEAAVRDTYSAERPASALPPRRRPVRVQADTSKLDPANNKIDEAIVVALKEYEGLELYCRATRLNELSLSIRVPSGSSSKDVINRINELETGIIEGRAREAWAAPRGKVVTLRSQQAYRFAEACVAGNPSLFDAATSSSDSSESSSDESDSSSRKRKAVAPKPAAKRREKRARTGDRDAAEQPQQQQQQAPVDLTELDPKLAAALQGMKEAEAAADAAEQAFDAAEQTSEEYKQQFLATTEKRTRVAEERTRVAKEGKRTTEDKKQQIAALLSPVGIRSAAAAAREQAAQGQQQQQQQQRPQAPQ